MEICLNPTTPKIEHQERLALLRDLVYHKYLKITGGTDHPREIRKYLQKEVEYKSVIRPFQEIPFSVAMLSPLNTTEKRVK